MKDLILHIGATKTGSSAIQRFLWENRSTLEAFGICYPDVGIASSAHHLLAAAIHPSAWKMHAGAFAGKDRGTYFRELVYRLQQIAATTPANTIFVSSEYLWGRFGQLFFSEIEILFRTFNVRLLCYIRRQDEWLESTYVQSVKSGDGRTFSEWLLANLDREAGFCHYDAILGQWEQIIPTERIHVRLYEPFKENYDSVSDVLDYLAIADRQAFIFSSEKANPSPMALDTEIIRLINRSNLPADKKLKLRNAVLRISKKKEPNARFSYLSADETIQLLKRYEAGNTTIAKKYFNSPSGQLFTRPLPKPGEWDAWRAPIIDESIIEALSELPPVGKI